MKNLPRLAMRTLFTTVVLLVVALTAPAQDVVKVSPETHKVLLENDQVRVLGVRIKPGEKVGMHSHPHNVIYYLSDGKLKLTYPDGKGEEHEVKAGTAVWNDAATHAAENVGTADFNEVQIELKGPTKKLTRAKKEPI